MKMRLQQAFFNSSQPCRCGPQQREIGFPISTDNASWRGPNIEAGGKSAYNNVQVGVGQR
ncbi:hypothetical protein XD32_04710 [Staphylococcus aureus]|nr:hypothetical protein [Staphylococcus aureus]